MCADPLKAKCKTCEKWYTISTVEKKYGLEWWTELYCSADCAILSPYAHLIKTYSFESVRFSVTMPTHLYERLREDADMTDRKLNGQITYIVKNYYIARDIQKQHG